MCVFVRNCSFSERKKMATNSWALSHPRGEVGLCPGVRAVGDRLTDRAPRGVGRGLSRRDRRNQQEVTHTDPGLQGQGERPGRAQPSVRPHGATCVRVRLGPSGPIPPLGKYHQVTSAIPSSCRTELWDLIIHCCLNHWDLGHMLCGSRWPQQRQTGDMVGVPVGPLAGQQDPLRRWSSHFVVEL